MKFNSGTLIALSMALAFSSCYYPPPPQPLDLAKARVIIGTNLKAHMAGLSEDMAFMQDMQLFKRMGALMFGSMECSGAAVLDPISGEPTGQFTDQCAFLPGEEVFNVDSAEMAQDIVDIIETYILADSQIDSFTDTNVSLRLKPDVFCPMFSIDLIHGDSGSDEMSDAESMCRDFLTAVPVWLSLTSYWEGSLYVDVSVGEYRTMAFQFQTYWDMMSVNLDLTSMTSAIDMANSLFFIDGKPMYDKLNMSGWLNLWMGYDYTGTHQVGLSFSDGTRVAVEKGEDRYSAEFAATTFAMYTDGDSEKVTLAVSGGNMDIAFPYQVMIDWWWSGVDGAVPEVDGTVRVRGDGFGFVAQTVGNIGVSIENVNMNDGFIQVSRDFDSLVGVQVLPENVGAFDSMVSADDAGDPTVAISNGAGILIDWNLHEIAGDLPEVPAGMADEKWIVAIDGNAPEFTVLQGQQSQWLRIDSGTLSVSTNGVPGPGVSVQAGQCAQIGAAEEGGHILLSAVKAVECL
jgi:hypothetical protein